VGTDTVTPPAAPRLPLQMVSVAPMLADALSRLHQCRSLADLLVHG
jgi:phosphoribosylpyrophosphate synthetase